MLCTHYAAQLNHNFECIRGHPNGDIILCVETHNARKETKTAEAGKHVEPSKLL